MTKRVFEQVSKYAAERILACVYDNDRSSVYGGSWVGPKRYVYGNILLAIYDNEQERMTVKSWALSTQAGLNDYLPAEFRS